MKRTIKTDRYDIKPNPRSNGSHVELELVRREACWELNGEPMTMFGEVIANIGLIGEHREGRRGGGVLMHVQIVSITATADGMSTSSGRGRCRSPSAAR
jgi:hypothetical protein